MDQLPWQVDILLAQVCTLSFWHAVKVSVVCFFHIYLRLCVVMAELHLGLGTSSETSTEIFMLFILPYVYYSTFLVNNISQEAKSQAGVSKIKFGIF